MPTILDPGVYTPTLPEMPGIQYIPKDDIAEKIKNAFAKYWNVVVWNDDVHTYAYVIAVLMAVLGINENDAFKHADTINNKGKSIVITTTQEKAEHYCAQIKEFELGCTIERDS
jgi:ATP-dependent Clp protease adaptor protein ClpS